uniref:Uromodulin-like n=1 Tax=Saccoglossus kowalevskii TaxID=10224 RepID=A0ABM0MF48_SACKO|nr:PREDICTED: uromodulin-like [Saccoglossus kowalevskii]
MSELICDYEMEEGWYRFTSEAGGEIPSSCIEVDMCGTVYPAWIHDVISETSSISTVRVCINTGDPGCCGETINIRVKKCPNDYSVYELKPLMNGCMGYCAGDRMPCPPGEQSPNGDFHPECSDIITVSSTTASAGNYNCTTGTGETPTETRGNVMLGILVATCVICLLIGLGVGLTVGYVKLRHYKKSQDPSVDQTNLADEENYTELNLRDIVTNVYEGVNIPESQKVTSMTNLC